MALGLSGSGLITGFDSASDGFGRVLQVVRATDTTNRTTTSTSYVDANISVTIMPTKNTSAILLVWTAQSWPFGAQAIQDMQITDSSNIAISGAEAFRMGINSTIDSYLSFTAIAYATPATTSSVTYKGRFKLNSASSTARLQNLTTTGQMYAIEVAA